jgi:hypothetical protein
MFVYMLTQTQIVVVGQGMAGTMLSWFLHKLQIPFVVINDDAQQGTSLTVETGIINPVTGRRYVESWQIDTLLPFAVNTYNDIATFLNIQAITPLTIAQFFANEQMQQAFMQRKQDGLSWLGTIDNATEAALHQHYHFYNTVGTISPGYAVHMKTIIETWRAYLIKTQRYFSKSIQTAALPATHEGYIIIDDIKASQVIFCGGVSDAFQSLFCALPFSIHKGEFIIINTVAPLPNKFIYKHQHTMVPLGTNKYWVGSNYVWQFQNVLPSALFAQQQQHILDGFLKQPYTITHHGAALRPATVERRPFVGFHPVYKNMGIFNGLGTKGCSLAPWYAHQLATQLVTGTTAIDKEVDIKRFENILSK